MPLNATSIRNNIVKELTELSVIKFKSDKKKPKSLKNPIIEVQAYVDPKIGSCNVRYTYPMSSKIHKDVLKDVKKRYPTTNRIMTFCQSSFDAEGRSVLTQCMTTNEDGRNLSISEKYRNEVSSFQKEIKNIIQLSVQPEYKNLHPEVLRLIKRLS